MTFCQDCCTSTSETLTITVIVHKALLWVLTISVQNAKELQFSICMTEVHTLLYLSTKVIESFPDSFPIVPSLETPKIIHYSSLELTLSSLMGDIFESIMGQE